MSLPPAFRFIIVAGMPRSGSMWTYNVARGLLAAAGRRVEPTVVPQRDDEMVALLGQAHAHPDDAVCCLKIHSRLRRLPSDARLIVNIRDVRDAMISYMRFMHADFERGLKAVEGMMALTDHYVALGGAERLIVRYESIVAEPRPTLAAIARFLGLSLGRKALLAVEREWSKASIKEKIARAERDLMERRREGGPLRAIDVAANVDGTFRVYDPATGFQSGHIAGDGAKGWRELLDPAQRERLLVLTRPWLERHGIPA
ncbi:MAG: sulfotransferase domain-containing protein [Proteobacteria bacterium]|nr:sulfotransferase domain-containing protein [Pseudomonadota bacterium]